MKKLSLWWILCVVLVLQSCVLKEDIHVSTNGKIDYKMEIDYGQLVSNLGQDEVERMLSESGGFINQKPVTVLEFFKNNSNANVQNQKELDSLMQANPELEKIFKTVEIGSVLKGSQANTFFEFKSKNIKEFNQTLKGLSTLSEIGSTQSNKLDDPTAWLNNTSSYSFDKNTFQRKVDLQKQTDYSKSKASGTNMMQYQITVSFDKRIKKVSYPDALLSQDGKSFTKTFELSDILNNPSILEYSVELH
ncbi:hypothetical protein [Myroides sp. LJL119]